MAAPVHGNPQIDREGKKVLAAIKKCNNGKFWRNVSYELAKELIRAAGILFVGAIFHAFTMTEKKRGGSTGGNKRAKKRNRLEDMQFVES